MTDLKKGVSRFQLLGTAKINDKTFAINQKGKNNSNYIFNQLNLGIDCGNGEPNVIYTTLMDGYDTIKGKTIYCHGEKTDDNGKKVDDYEKQILVNFADRELENEEIAESCYITVGIVKDTEGNIIKKKFLSAYDVVAYLKENLKEGMVVSVRGNLKFTVYQGKTQMKREMTSIWISNAEKKDFKAAFEQQIWFTQDGFNEKVDEDGYMPIYGYVVDYYDKDVKNVCYPFSLNINTVAMPKYETIIKNYLRPDKKENVNKVSVEGRWVKTDNTVEVTYEDLSQDLKDQVDLGMLTEEEALGRVVGNQRGEFKTLFKSICTRKDSKTGVITLLVDKDNSKVEDIVLPPEKTEAEKVLDSVGSEVKKKTTSDDDGAVSQDVLNDLFGL